MRIISKYVLKEHLGPLVFALSALTSLLLLNYVAKQFERLVGKGLPWSVIGEFFLLSIPFTVAMTLPMAVLVATLYAFSRLAAENEMTALKASGVSMVRVLAPVIVGASALAVFMVAFNDQVLPRANHRLSLLQQDIARVKPTLALRERTWNELAPGRTFLQTNYLDGATNRMREITIYDMANPATSRTIRADSGRLEMSENQTDLLLTLYDGHVQEVPKRSPGQFQRHYFREDRIRIRGVGNSLQRSDAGGYKGDREMSICEMQAQVNSAHSEYVATRQTLGEFLASAAREAVTGSFDEPVATPQRSVARSGIGQTYCVVLARLQGHRRQAPRIEEAAEPEVASRRPDGEAGQSFDDGPVTVEMTVADTAAPAPASAVSAAPPGARPTPQAARPGVQPPVQPPVRPATPARRPLTPPGESGAPSGGQAPLPIGESPYLRDAQGSPVQRPRVIDDRGLERAVADSPAAGSLLPYHLRPQAQSRLASRLTPASAVSGRIEALRSQMEISARTQNSYDVEIQKKFALAVACVVFVLLGAPVALRFPRGGVGMTLGVSLVVFAIYYVGLIGGEALADRGMLTPFWAMWAANAIFAVAGLALIARMGREGATSRGGDWGEMREALRSWLARQGRRVGLPLERRTGTRRA